jgi:ethylbenzene dioxygenase subunit beta
MSESPSAGLATELVSSLTQRLYQEARLLDGELYDEWLGLLDEQICYRMVLKSRRFRADRSAPAPVGPGFVFNENLERIKLRIDRLRSGFVWAEDPQNFVRRVISNVEVLSTNVPDEVRVHSVVVIHRNRLDGATRVLTAGRSDRWRRNEDIWRMVARDIALDHAVLPDSNVNVFF